jgi:hypothetical protein
MGGGLMQLVAYGAQDIYLTGNPQITFFKVVYRRHTNFSMEAIQQTWNGNSAGDSAGRCTSTISRNGDLVYRMYLEVLSVGNSHMKDNIDNPMANAITDVEIEIGGQKIDKHTGAWMNVWAHLTEPNHTGYTGELAATSNVGEGTIFQNISGMAGARSGTGGTVNKDYRFFTPLYFWFCRNPGLALPLIALQYHEVKVILNHNFVNSFTVSPSGILTNDLWCDYIYLDTDERRRFAQVSHEYLIEQVQEQSLSIGLKSTKLNFNHPVKELIWTHIVGGSDAAGATTTLSSNYTANYQVTLNGSDRFEARDIRYFTRTQIWEHHSGPGGLKPADGKAGGRFSDGIGVYSFALKPEEHQPSGTCNFSRIDNAQFVAGSTDNVANIIYAVNYNVLRIMSGMGGLAYSN